MRRESSLLSIRNSLDCLLSWKPSAKVVSTFVKPPEALPDILPGFLWRPCASLALTSVLFGLPISVSAAPNLVDSAVQSFRKGQLDDAAFQLERAEQDDPSLLKDEKARRLRLFLHLATGRFDRFDRLAQAGTDDPMLAYLMALRRLNLRDFEGAAKLYPVVLQGKRDADLRRLLSDPARLRSSVPMPFACSDSTEAGWDALLSDVNRIIRMYDERPGPVELAVVFFLWKSRQSGWSGVYTGVPEKEMPSLPPESAPFLSLVFKPDKKKLLRCSAELSRSRPGFRRNSYRILFDLMMRVDDSPSTYRQIAHRYLNEPVADEGSAMLAIEALHALRAGLDRLPPLDQAGSSHLSHDDRRAIEERLLIYRLLQQTYERLNRSSDAIQLAQVAAVLERYIASPAAFPRKELRDRTGEDLYQREGLVLRLQLADAVEAAQIKRKIAQYDARRSEEHMAVFRRIYSYR